MDELKKVRIEMRVRNQYGDNFVTVQEVDEDYCGFDEMDIYHNAYLNFLRTVGFVIPRDALIDIVE